jgi:hypothetical protein
MSRASSAWRGVGALAALGVTLGTAGLTAGLVAAPASAGGTAKVNVVHGIPGVAVKICVDGKAVADNFRYGHTIVGAILPATTHNVRLVAAGKQCRATAILKSRYTLSAGRNYTIVANINARGTANLKVYVNPVKPTARGNARLTVRHTAQAPAVNVWAGRTKIIGGAHFTWGRGATHAVPAGTYKVKVSLPGSRKAVIGPTTKTLAAGRAYQVYAVGTPGHYRLVTVKTHVGTR